MRIWEFVRRVIVVGVLRLCRIPPHRRGQSFAPEEIFERTDDVDGEQAVRESLLSSGSLGVPDGIGVPRICHVREVAPQVVEVDDVGLRVHHRPWARAGRALASARNKDSSSPSDAQETRYALLGGQRPSVSIPDPDQHCVLGGPEPVQDRLAVLPTPCCVERGPGTPNFLMVIHRALGVLDIRCEDERSPPPSLVLQPRSARRARRVPSLATSRKNLGREVAADRLTGLRPGHRDGLVVFDRGQDPCARGSAALRAAPSRP